MEERLKNGIDINVNTVKEMKNCAVDVGLDIGEYLGKEAAEV